MNRTDFGLWRLHKIWSPTLYQYIIYKIWNIRYTKDTRHNVEEWNGYRHGYPLTFVEISLLAPTLGHLEINVFTGWSKPVKTRVGHEDFEIPRILSERLRRNQCTSKTESSRPRDAKVVRGFSTPTTNRRVSGKLVVPNLVSSVSKGIFPHTRVPLLCLRNCRFRVPTDYKNHWSQGTTNGRRERMCENVISD